jgi:hypothetical protein
LVYEQKNGSETLRIYHRKAVEIAELRRQVGDKIGALTPEDAQKELDNLLLQTKEFNELRMQLPPRDLFLAKYAVVPINDHTVSFVIPPGVSGAHIIREAHELVTDRCFLNDRAYETLQQRSFAAINSKPVHLCVDGHVQGTIDKTELEQRHLLEERGLTLASERDVAIAFALFYIARGEPLFGWFNARMGWTYYIRSEGARGSVLMFDTAGLRSHSVEATKSRPHVAAAAYVPSLQGNHS